MRNGTRPLIQRLALGAAAGLAGTVVMQGMMKASGKLLPDAKPPVKQDPAEFMVNKAKQYVPVPDKVAPAAAKSLQLGYGTTSGLLYATLRPRGGSAFLDGSLLGLGVWAAGYLGWLPATDLMPPITEHQPQQIVVPIVQHALFGVAVSAIYDALLRM